MTDDEIIEIRDSLLPSQGEQFDQLAFGRAIAAAEREACATVCESLTEDIDYPDGQKTRYPVTQQQCADAIRMRSNA